jgi:hypothetical protein
MRSRTGPLPNLANTLLALRCDPALADLLSYDEMLAAALLMRALSGAAPSETFMPRPVTDDDVGIIQEHLQKTGLRRVGQNVVNQAVDMRARERSFHPVKQYLASVTWMACLASIHG